MNDKPRQRALEREVLPRRTGVVTVRDERAARLLIALARDEEQERCGIAAPDLIALDQQIEEERPLFCVATRVENAARLRVAG